jgi:hypothetical protein
MAVLPGQFAGAAQIIFVEVRTQLRCRRKFRTERGLSLHGCTEGVHVPVDKRSYAILE